MATIPYMDQPLDRVAISGPILAHVLHDFNAARGDCDGVLFGHLEKTVSAKFEDDDELSGMREELTAIVTGYFCSGSVLSFYDACGRIIPSKLAAFSRNRASRGGDPPIGWFSGRHNTPMRPSLRETAVTRSLRLPGLPADSEGFATLAQGHGKDTHLRNDQSGPAPMSDGPIKEASLATESSSRMAEGLVQTKENKTMPEKELNAAGSKVAPINLDTSTGDIGKKVQPIIASVRKSLQGSSLDGALPNPGKNVCVPRSAPCLFMLITESGAGQAVHSQEYRVYQYHFNSKAFVPRTLRIANIGPAFRVDYDSFSPVTSFPLLHCGPEGEGESSSSSTGINSKQREVHPISRRTRSSSSKEQMLLDAYSEGYNVERLASLANPDKPKQVLELEDLYSRMLRKLETMAKHVCETSSSLLQQEKVNKQLRLNDATLE